MWLCGSSSFPFVDRVIPIELKKSYVFRKGGHVDNDDDDRMHHLVRIVEKRANNIVDTTMTSRVAVVKFQKVVLPARVLLVSNANPNSHLPREIPLRELLRCIISLNVLLAVRHLFVVWLSEIVSSLYYRGCNRRWEAVLAGKGNSIQNKDKGRTISIVHGCCVMKQWQTQPISI